MPFEIVIIVALGSSVALLSPLVRAWARRVETRGAPPRLNTDVDARLRRMETAIDAIAVEVERIAEGQRFTSRLLVERGPASANDVPRADAAMAEVSHAR